jgi:hypothetical protein
VRAKQVQPRWVKLSLMIVGVVGLVLLLLFTRGCDVKTLGQWTEKTSAGTSPSARSGQALVWDASGGKSIMFGGSYAATMDAERTYLDDTWAYDPAAGTWSEVATTGGGPSARFGHAMVYDPDTGTVLMFGGYDQTTPSGAGLSDLWEYDPGTGAWSELEPPGDRPPGGEYQATVYDSRTRRLLLLVSVAESGTAGDSSTFKYVDQLWAYDREADAWTKLDPGGDSPPGLAAEAMVYDPGTGRVLVFGGYYTSLDAGRPESEFGWIANESLWAYDPATNEWNDLKPGGDRPPGTSLPYFVYSPSIQKCVLLVQGITQDGALVSAMWSYDSTANRWTRIKPTDKIFPAVRLAGSMVSCSEQPGILLYGGSRPEKPEDLSDLTQAYVYPEAVWVYSVPAAAAR